MNVGELVAYLRLDDSKYRKTLDAAEKGAKGLGSALLKGGAGIAALGSGVQVVGGLAAALGTAAGAALVLPAVFGAVKLATAAATVGMQGFSDAMGSLDDPAAFAEAVGKLAPAAREAAIAVRGQKGAWDALQLDVQQKLFQGIGSHITALGGRYLPVLRGALGGVAGDMNAAGRATASWLDRDPAQATVTTTLDNMRAAIRNVLEAVSPLANALFNVMAVGAEFLPGLTGGAGEAAERFADLVANMRDSGELHDIISRGLSALGDLAQVGGNVAQIIGGIFRAASTDGGSFLSTLEASTQAIADMVNSADGQEALTAFFATAATLSGLFMQALSALLPVLPPLVTVLGTLAVNIGTLLVGALTAIAPYLEIFARWLVDNPGLVMGVAIALGVLVVAMNGLLAAARIVGVVQAIMATGWLGMAAGALSTAASVVWSWITMAASSIASAATMAASWFIALGPIGWVIAAVVALVALIIANWDSVVAATQWLVGKAGELLAWFGTLPGLFAQWFEGAKNAALAKGGELLGWLGSLPGRFLGILGGLGSLLVSSGRALVDGFLSGIRSAWNGLVGWVRDGMATLRSYWPFSPAKAGAFSGSGYVTYSGRALTGDFENSLRAGMPGIIASARELMDAAHVELNAGLPGGAPGGGPLLPGPRPGEGPGGGPAVSIAIYNPAAQRASDDIGKAGSVLAALGPWED